MKRKRILAAFLAAVTVISGLPISGMKKVHAAGGAENPVETITSGVGVSVKYGDSIGTNDGVYELSTEAQQVFSEMTFEDGEGILLNVLYRFPGAVKGEMVPLFAVSGMAEDTEKCLTVQHNAAGGQLGYIGSDMTANGLFTTKNHPNINNSQITTDDWHKCSEIFYKSGDSVKVYIIYDGEEVLSWDTAANTACRPAPQHILDKTYNISKIYFGKTPHTGTSVPGEFNGEVKYVEVKKLSTDTVADEALRNAENTKNVADYAKKDIEAFLEETESLKQADYTATSWATFEAAKTELQNKQSEIEGGSLTDIQLYNALQTAIDAKDGLMKFSAEAKYVSGSSQVMGEISAVTDQESGTVEFTATPAEFYKFDGWYEDEEAATSSKSSDKKYTYQRQGAEEQIVLYAKFVSDTEAIDSLIEKVKGVQQGDGYTEDYTEATRTALAEALSAAEGEKTGEKAVALKAALANLETAKEVRYAEEQLTAGGEITVSEDDAEIISHVKGLTVDIVYKMQAVADTNDAFLTLVGKDGAYMTFFHNTSNGRMGYYLSTDSGSVGFSNGGADTVGKWEKVTIAFQNTDTGMTVSFLRNGAKTNTGFPFSLNQNYRTNLKAFLEEEGISKVLVGKKQEGAQINVTNSTAVADMVAENVEAFRYVKISSSTEEDLKRSQKCDASVEAEYTALLQECGTLVEGNYTQDSWTAFQEVLAANKENDEGTWTKSDWAMLDAIDAITAAKGELVEAAEKEAYAAYADGSDNTMGTISVAITEKESSQDKQAVFSAEANEYYKFAGWYQNQEGTEKADEEHYMDNPYTCDIPETPVPFTLYGKFAIDTEKIEELIAQAEEKQQEAGYADTYTDASRETLADALAAAKAEGGKTLENAKALKAAIEGLIVKGEEPLTEILYAGENEDGTLAPGEKELSDREKAFYDGLEDIWVDVLYKYNGDAVPDKNIALFTISDGGTEEGQEQYVTLWHDPANARVAFASACLTNGTVSTTGSGIFWTSKVPASGGEWHKLTFGLTSQDMMFYAAQDGATLRSGGFASSTIWTQMEAFFAHAWKSGKVQIGERAAKGTYVTMNQGGDLVNFNDESVDGVLKYVKVKKTAADEVTENQIIDEEIEAQYDALLEECATKKAADYTKASWDVFQAALDANQEKEDGTWTKSDWAMMTAIDEISAAMENLRAYKAVEETSLSIGTEYALRKAGTIFDGTEPDSAEGSYVQVRVNPEGEEINPADMEITWSVAEGSTGITVNAIDNYPSKATLAVEPGAKGTIQATVTTRNGVGEEKTMTAECAVTVGYEIKAEYVTGSSLEMGSTQIAGKDSAGNDLDEGSLLLPGDKAVLTPQTEAFYLFRGWYKDEAGTEAYEDTAVDSYTYTVKEDDPEAEDGVITFYAKFELDKENIVPVETITLTPAKDTLTEVGETTQITAAVTPDNASIQTFDWSSDNEAAATVDQNGLVTAVADGEATITAKAKDGSNMTGSCKITVKIGQEPDNRYPFVDIDPEFWKEDRAKLDAALKFVSDNKYMTGYSEEYPDGVHFGPADNLLRYQFALIVYRMAGSPEFLPAAESKFKDVTLQTVSAEAKEAIFWAESMGIIKGYDETTFGPNDKITRAQMMTMMYRYAEKVEKLPMGEGDYSDLAQFGSEVNEIQNDEMKKAISWCVGKGIVGGVTVDGKAKLLPQGTAVRAQCAIVVSGFAKVFDEAAE